MDSHQRDEKNHEGEVIFRMMMAHSTRMIYHAGCLECYIVLLFENMNTYIYSYAQSIPIFFLHIISLNKNILNVKKKITLVR